MKNTLDYAAINAAALRLYPSLLQYWFPGGHLHGNEYDTLNPLRVDNTEGSFRINIVSGEWADFANLQRGKTPISLYATFFCDGETHAAAERMAQQLGLDEQRTIDPAIAKFVQQLDKKIKTDDAGWAQIPVPGHATEPPLPVGAPYWIYRNERGDIIGYVARVELPGKRKKYVPVTYWQHQDGRESWRNRQFPRPLPLYNRYTLELRPDAAVLIVEGEKAAEAAAHWFPEFVCVSWPTGSNSADYVDWSPLRGKTVCILPDNDEAGRKAGRTIYTRLLSLNCIVHLGSHRDELPVGWDVADADFASIADANTWLEQRVSWETSSQQKTVHAKMTDEGACIAIEKANAPAPCYVPIAAALARVEPIPVPVLAQLEQDIARRVDAVHPLATQQVVLAIAAHACARRYRSTSNDPCSLSLAVVSQSVGLVRPYLDIVFRLFEAANLRSSIRQTRISTSNGLYKLLYTAPALLYLSSEYGGMLKFARRQPAGSLEQTLNTLSEIYSTADVSIDLQEIGIKGFDGADQNILRAPTVNLLALLSHDDMTAVFKASEVGRGALEQLQAVILDDDRLHMNSARDVLPIETPFNADLIAHIRTLRGLDDINPLECTQGYAAPVLRPVGWSCNTDSMHDALEKLGATTTRAARPLLIAARSNIRRLCTVLAAWSNPKEPVITESLLSWVTRREADRLSNFISQFDHLTSDEGKVGPAQKVLQAICDARGQGITERQLQQSCWAFRTLPKIKRQELLDSLIEDEEIVGIRLANKRTPTYFGRQYVKSA